jgi:hypothetical protein
MATVSQAASVSRGALWTGRVLSGIVVALFVFSGVMKIKMKYDADHPPATAPASVEADPKATAHDPQKDLDPIGWKLEIIGVIGIIEICCAVLYAIPQTAVLGAILLTGYLGGACATHVRVGEYGLSIAPVAFGVVIWIALYLRDRRLRALAPIRSLT